MAHEPEPIEVDRVGIGVTIAGAALMAVAVFLPRVESETFLRVAENTLIQGGDGWLFIGLAVGVGASLYRTVQAQSQTWTILVLGIVGIGLAIYEGTGERLELVSQAGDGLFGSRSETASPGVGIYAAGAGGALVAYGGALLAGVNVWPGGAQLPARQTKKCPECAETVLADARVCKHCGHEFEQFAPPQTVGGKILGSTPTPTRAWRCDLCDEEMATYEAALDHADKAHPELTIHEARDALRAIAEVDNGDEPNTQPRNRQ